MYLWKIDTFSHGSILFLVRAVCLVIFVLSYEKYEDFFRKRKASVMEHIRKQLQCQSCLRPIFPPFLMCEKGESVCNDCRQTNKNCPLCKKKFTNNPNTALEALAQLECFKCTKCSVPLKLISLKEHYKKCLENEALIKVDCPIEKCSWKGGTDEVAEHWRSKKLSLRPFVEDNICRTKPGKYSYFCNIVEAHTASFFFKSECNEGKFFWALQYVGNPNEAQKFQYEIEIINPHKLACKFTLSSYCQSIDLNKAELFKEGVSIFTPKELLEPYLTDNGVLLYNLRVYEVNQSDIEKYRKKVNKLLEKYAKK